MLKLQNEQWFLFAVLLIAGGLMAFKAMELASLEEMPQPKINTPPKFDPAPYQEAATRLLNPPEVKEGEHKVYVSRLIAYFPGDKSVKPVSPDLVDEHGITIRWKVENQFDISDPKVWEADTDKDGFINKEEFLAKTNPRDPDSRPGLLLKLRVEKFTKVPFRVKFQGYNPDVTTGQMIYQLNLLDVRTNKTRMVKEGDTIEGYKVGAFRRKIETVFDPKTNSEKQVDMSELDLINLRLDEIVTLIRDKEIESDESFVILRVDSPRGKVVPSRVVRGDKFKLDGKEYQLIKPSDKTITIKDLETGKLLSDIGG